MVERRTSYIIKVSLDQAVVVGRDTTGGFPENGIDVGRTSHDRPTAVDQIVATCGGNGGVVSLTMVEEMWPMVTAGKGQRSGSRGAGWQQRQEGEGSDHRAGGDA